MKAVATQAAKDLKAYGRDAGKPNADRLTASLAKSRARTVKVVSKTLLKVEKKGTPYNGLEPDALADAARQIFDNFELGTRGEEPF